MEESPGDSPKHMGESTLKKVIFLFSFLLMLYGKYSGQGWLQHLQSPVRNEISGFSFKKQEKVLLMVLKSQFFLSCGLSICHDIFYLLFHVILSKEKLKFCVY